MGERSSVFRFSKRMSCKTGYRPRVRGTNPEIGLRSRVSPLTDNSSLILKVWTDVSGSLVTTFGLKG